MVIFSLGLIAGTTNLSAIVAFMASHVDVEVSFGLALVGFIMIAIAENARIPVDNPATHLELTMVHEAMVLEYSGRHLALIEWAASLKLLLYISLLACIFAPWGISTFRGGAEAALIALAAYLGKVAVGGALLGFFEVSVAKMRVFRVPEFLGAALMLAFLATLLRLVARSL